MKTFLSWLASIMLMLSFSAQADTAVITLNNNAVNDILPIVEKMLTPGGNASAFQGKIIINSTAENIADIKRVLAAIDKPGKQLLISVKQGGTTNESVKGYDAEGEIQVNPHVTITHNNNGTITENTASQVTIKTDSASVNVVDNQNSSTDNALQHVRAMEGYPAHIYIGQQIPVVNAYRDYNGRLSQDVTYKDANKGFFVIAYLVGDDQVQIDIKTENDQLSATKGRIIEGTLDNKHNAINPNTIIDTQHAGTTMTARLGQWIPMGGVNQSGVQNQSGYFSQGTQTKVIGNTIYIKVDVVE